MSLEIERVETQQQLRDFIKVPWTVYKEDPNWVPWLFFERLEFFDKTKNALFEHAEGDFFIARRDGRPVGAIAALVNHRHNEFQGENVAHFGAFEVLNDPAAAAALLDTACNWARERAVDKIVGPMNLSTNDECGFLVEGFDSPPVILMTYNPPYYLDFVEAAGFTKAMGLIAWHTYIADLMAPGGMPEKLIRVVNKTRERYALTIRPLNMKDWENEIERVKKVYNSAWEKNWGFVPMTDAEIHHLAEGLKPVIDPEMAFLVEKEGETVGFSLTVPNVNEVLRKIRPGPSRLSAYIGAARMLLMKRQVKGLRVIALGVIEAYRARGVDALMYYESVKAAHRRGYEWAEASWILETNDAMNRPLEMIGMKIYKRYRLYEKSLNG